jgi:hypothetical protein
VGFRAFVCGCALDGKNHMRSHISLYTRFPFENGYVLLGIAGVTMLTLVLFMFGLTGQVFGPSTPSIAADASGLVTLAETPCREHTWPYLKCERRPSLAASPSDLNPPPEGTTGTAHRELTPRRDSFDARFWVPAVAPKTDGVALNVPRPAKVLETPAPPVGNPPPAAGPPREASPPPAASPAPAADPPDAASPPPAASPLAASLPREASPLPAASPPPAAGSSPAPDASAPPAATPSRETRPVRELKRSARPPRNAREVRSDIVRSPDGREWKRITYEVPIPGGGTRRVQVSRPLNAQSQAPWGVFGRGF